ncbi:flavohemoglobin expression-modulating QEGLA motif protein [Blastococcus sp. Marseille-P5729]|uniref:flavohemoglobin expression-modulating QEGLA motif protein n=1 Tax=Blastococcus sp. Marseille-P5729 TaxID=2086582 RepID=UPI000D0E6224|nr:tyrosine/phenylalanine carboxypeptidase domain-containing protein [Blastococcus sp. Marseille-P5729]
MDRKGTTLSEHDLQIDAQLAELAGSFQFLLGVSPTNADHFRDEFVAGKLTEPDFDYRPLAIDPAELKRRLARIDVSQVEDSTLGSLLRAKHHEIELQLDMLEARCTEDFLTLSIELYGAITPTLRRQAEGVLQAVSAPSPKQNVLNAHEFLDMACDELNRYRAEAPGIDVDAEIRDDVVGVMVSGNMLLIGADLTVTGQRAYALLQHEVGTHLVTQINGADQPITCLGTGLAGYDETQEGLAVLAEIACAGLTTARLRQLAGRVLTAHRRVHGASFVEAFQALLDDGFQSRGAFITTMRAYRAGGMTKDAIYLRGLVDLLGHLRNGGPLELLWRGKFALEDLPHIEDLAERGILRPALVRPHYLEDPKSTTRLVEAARVTDLTALTQGAA